jgi:hypothetical protein
MPIIGSSSVVAVPSLWHVVRVYVAVAVGVNVYQMLRLSEPEEKQEGVGGSPPTVAIVTSTAGVLAGNGPAPGTTIAVAHVSFGGGANGALLGGAFIAAAMRWFIDCIFRSIRSVFRRAT